MASALSLATLPLVLKAQDASVSHPRARTVTTASTVAARGTSMTFWKPTYDTKEYRSDIIALPNGLVIDRRYEIPEARMRLLGEWLRRDARRNWDIMPAREYTGIVQHATEGSFENDLQTLQSYGKAHFLIGRACADTVYSIVPLSWTANGAGDSHDRYGPAVARRTIQIEHEAREGTLLTAGQPVLTASQTDCSRKLTQWLQRTFTIDDRDVMSHAAVRVRYISQVVRDRINKRPGQIYFADGMLPDRIVAEANLNRWDGMSFPLSIIQNYQARFGPLDTIRVRPRPDNQAYRRRFNQAIFTILSEPFSLPDFTISLPPVLGFEKFQKIIPDSS